MRNKTGDRQDCGINTIQVMCQLQCSEVIKIWNKGSWLYFLHSHCRKPILNHKTYFIPSPQKQCRSLPIKHTTKLKNIGAVQNLVQEESGEIFDAGKPHVLFNLLCLHLIYRCWFRLDKSKLISRGSTCMFLNSTFYQCTFHQYNDAENVYHSSLKP